MQGAVIVFPDDAAVTLGLAQGSRVETSRSFHAGHIDRAHNGQADTFSVLLPQPVVIDNPTTACIVLGKRTQPSETMPLNVNVCVEHSPCVHAC